MNQKGPSPKPDMLSRHEKIQNKILSMSSNARHELKGAGSVQESEMIMKVFTNDCIMALLDDISQADVIECLDHINE